MADVDDTPVQTADDAGPSEAVETPTTAETPDTDVELEDIEVDLDGFDDDDDTEESEESPEDEAATESTDETEEEADDGADKPEEVEQSSEPDESKPTDTEEQPLSEAEQKRYNDEQAKRRIAEKQLREERKQREAADIQRYLKDAEYDQEELSRRESQVEQYHLLKERAELNSQKLEVAFDRAVSDIDLFKSPNPEVQAALDSAINDFAALYTTVDEQGNVLEVRGDIYQFLNNKADTIRKLTGVGARQEAQAKQNTKARTEPVPTRPPKEAKKDSDVSDFDSYFG